MTTTKPLPDLTYLQECFELSSESPSGLVWKKRPLRHFPTIGGHRVFNSRFPGKPAGSIVSVPNSDLQYWQVEILHQIYKIHRLVYSLSKGEVISEEVLIDHEDSNGLNNTPSNLRTGDAGNNSHNRRKPVTNKSGFKGVSYCKMTQSWVAALVHRGQRHRMRHFPTPEKANDWIIAIRQPLHKEFCNHG